MPKFVLPLLFVVTLLAACNQRPTPADPDLQPNPADTFAWVQVNLDPARDTVSAERVVSEQAELTAQQVTPSGEARELVNGTEFEQVYLGHQFLPDSSVLNLAFKNVTTDLFFVQPMSITVYLVEPNCNYLMDGTQPQVSGSFEVDLSDADLGGDGALEPGETSAGVELVIPHGQSGMPGCFFYALNAAVTDQLTTAESSQQVPVPYTVDGEIQGGVELLTTYTRKPAQASGTVDMYLLESIFNSVFLLDAEGEVVAFDVVAKDIKETVTFNYVNSAKADVYLSLTLTGLTFEQLLSSYARIEAHPRFTELVDFHRAAGRVPLSDEASNLSRAIAVDIYNDFQEDTSQLSTQTVLDDFGGDGSVSFSPIRAQDSDDPRKVSLMIKDTSVAQRLFVFEGEDHNLSLDFLNNANSVPTSGQTYISESSNFYGFRPVGGSRFVDFSLNVPEDDCKVYTLATSAFARGPGSSVLSQENNPQYANFANAIGSVFTLYGAFTGDTPNKSTLDQLIDAAYPVWVTSESGVTNGQKFANALREGDVTKATDAMFDTVYDGARAIAETTQGESLPEIIADLSPGGSSATRKAVKSRVRAVIAAPAAAGLSVFFASIANEYDDDIKSARFSTGDPVIELVSSTDEVKLALEESESGTLTIRNTGCRDLEYNAGHVYINDSFYTFDLQELTGTVPPEEQKELPFSVTCFDIEDSGLSKVSAFDKDLNSPADAKIISDDVDIDITCGLSRIEVDAQYLFGVRGGSKVVSNALGDVTGFPAREHFSNNPIEVYVVEPGTQEVRLGVQDGDGYLVLGLKKTFELEPGDVVQWTPSASLNVDMKAVYDGPVDDCERLQGVYTVDIDGVFDTYPDIPIAQSAMYIDGAALNIIEREKLANKPLRVDARTIRSCNLEEREHAIGWDIEHNFFNSAPEGFYAFIDGPMDNVDNRWPSYTWNRTDIAAGVDLCFPISFNILTQSIAGRPDAPQNLYSVSPGGYGDVLMRFETLYEQIFRESSAGGLATIARFSPGFIDRKFTYNGVEQWVHTVGKRGEPECGGAGGMSTQSLRTQGTPSLEADVLFEPFEQTTPVQERRKGF